MSIFYFVWRMARIGLRGFKASVILGITIVLCSAVAQAAPVHQATDPLDALATQIGDIRATTPTLYENFRQPDDRWEVDGDEEFELYYYVGAYFVYVEGEDLIVWGNSDIEASDFYLEVDAFHASGPLDNQFGIVFRQVDLDNFYLFTISSDGYYKLEKQVDDEWSTLIDWTESEYITSGEETVNQIGVLAQGDQIGLLVNDTVLEVVTDDTFAEGIIGLAAGAYDEAGVEIAFDDLKLWELLETPPTVAAPKLRLNPSTTATPAPGSDVSALLADYRAEAALLSDDFSASSDGWLTSETEDGIQQFADGGYAIEIKTGNSMLWSSYQRAGDVTGRFLAEVEVELVEGPPTTDMGLLFHMVDNNNFSFYALRGDGAYSLWHKAGGNWETVIEWTADDAILTEVGAVNRLGLYSTGSLLTLLVNDVVVAQAPNAPANHGWFALAAGANSADPIAVVFDNFDLWTDEPLPEPTPTATATPAPELPDLAEYLAEIRAVTPDLSDEFRWNNGDWGVSEGDNATLAYADRTLQIAIKQPNWLSWSMNQQITGDQLAAFYLEVDTERLAGGPDNEYGVLFHWLDGDNFYGYFISGHGAYSLWRKVNGEWQALIPWSANTAIATDEEVVNRLGLLVEGDQMTLLVNDTVIGQTADDALAGGSLALVAGTFEESGLEVRFDNVDFWTLAE